MFDKKNYQNSAYENELMGDHNLFNQYEPSLQYGSIFRYFQMPSNDVVEDQATKKVTSSEKLITNFIILFMYIVVLITFPVTGFFVLKKIKSLERCLVYRLGKRLPLKGPGIYLNLPCIDNFVMIDLNKKEFKVLENEPILTSDGSLVEVQEFKAIISISNVVKSITQVKDSQPTVEQFIKISFKNMISSNHVDDIERKLDVLVMTFVSNINLSLANWGWSMQTTDLPKIIVKNGYEAKNQVMNVLKSYFDPASKPTTVNVAEPQNSLQMLKQAIFGSVAEYKLMKEEKCDQCTNEKDKMIENLEKVAERYTHMNVFNYKLFNIHLSIDGQSTFYTYDTKLKNATKKDKIENDTIHFTVNCKTLDDFQLFVDNNDSSGIELTTKLF